MIGWMIIFAATSTIGGVWSSAFQSSSALFVSVLFGILFVLALCVGAVRRADSAG